MVEATSEVAHATEVIMEATEVPLARVFSVIAKYRFLIRKLTKSNSTKANLTFFERGEIIDGLRECVSNKSPEQ